MTSVKCHICGATIPRKGNETDSKYKRRRTCYNPEPGKNGKRQFTECERKAKSSATWKKSGARKSPDQNRSAEYLARKAEENRKARVDKYERPPERSFVESNEGCSLLDIMGSHDIEACKHVGEVKVFSRAEIAAVAALYSPPVGRQRIGPTVPRRD